METDKRNFMKNPSIKSLILFTSLWFIGITLPTLSTTDLFTESFLKKKGCNDLLFNDRLKNSNRKTLL